MLDLAPELDEIADNLPSWAEAEKAFSSWGNVIGTGVYRTVYRLPGSKWVYKKDNVGGVVNRQEFTNYSRFRPSLIPGVAFPEMHMVSETVIACEYIEGSYGDQGCWSANSHNVYLCPRNDSSDCWANKLAFLAQSIKDLHYGNVKITSDGTIYVIDMGEYIKNNGK